ncbi:hypothetical protein HORIV_11650 [Vreelandella olivaria]|uniref:Uncharacterized protein n=1 Tax=Vreelandella olivaria TaxID=390919 RepID=A0ABN5WP22_9GAMM|nr:hypothetical protein HORIV_11650 [Halomonas olivaria]
MQENVPAGQASSVSQASSLSGSSVPGNGAVGASGREMECPNQGPGGKEWIRKTNLRRKARR